MRRIRHSIGVLALGATLVAACNSISGLNDDYTLDTTLRLPDADVSSSSSSSGSSDVDAQGTDAPSATGDTGTPDSDAGTQGDAWCPSGASWCENFDDTHTTWDRTDQVGGTLTEESGTGFNGTRALHAHANGVNMSRQIAHWRHIETGASIFPVGRTYWLTFRFKVTSLLSYAVIGALQANNTAQTNTEYGLAAYKDCPAGGDCLDENNPTEEGAHPYVMTTPLTTGTWHTADVRVVHNATGYMGTVTVDGSQVVDSNGETYFGTPQAPSLVEVGIGLFFTSNQNATADFFIDDIAAGHNGP